MASQAPAWIATAGGIAAALAFLRGRRDSKRSAASKVAPVIVHQTIPLGDEGADVHVEVVNGAETPIVDVKLAVLPWDWKRRRWRWRRPSRVDQRVISDMRGRSTSKVLEVRGAPRPKEMPKSVRAPMILEFTDGDGRRWARMPNSKLRRRWRLR